MRQLTCLVAASFVVVASLAAAQPVERSWLTDRDLDAHEQRLLNAEIVKVEEVGEGVTNPRRVTLQHEGETFHAVYKPLKRGRQKGFWESYQAEVAAYQLDRFLEIDMVPPTVIRRIEGNLGSLQLWVEGCDTYKRLEKKVPLTPVFSRQISTMKMFDNLIFNDDRNGGNFLLDEAWNIVLIDHSRAFIERKHLLKGKSKLPVQFDRKLVERLRGLNRQGLDTLLKGLLMGGQVGSILERRDGLLEYLERLVAERGEARVFFD